MLNKDNYIIWCSYHRDDIPKEYNLYNSKHFKLFNTNDISIYKDNINYLHDYLCDLTAYYYIWKNNLKSDYVGFCHYSKHFQHIDFDILNKFGFYGYDIQYHNVTLYQPKKEECYLVYDFIMYLKYKYNINYFDYVNKHKYMMTGWHNSYIFKWDVFCDVCDFIFGYLDYIFPNDLWKVKSNIDFIVKTKGNFNFDEILGNVSSWWPKYLSVFFEWIIGVYLGIKYNCNNYENEYFECSKYQQKQLYIICKDYIDENNFEQFKLWIKTNIKSGIKNYVIKSCYTKQQIEEMFEKNSNLQRSPILNNFVYDLIVLDKTDNKKLSNNKDDLIYLNLNERINCESSIEMHKGNYFIDKIN